MSSGIETSHCKDMEAPIHAYLGFLFTSTPMFFPSYWLLPQMAVSKIIVGRGLAHVLKNPLEEPSEKQGLVWERVK